MLAPEVPPGASATATTPADAATTVASPSQPKPLAKLASTIYLGSAARFSWADAEDEVEGVVLVPDSQELQPDLGVVPDSPELEAFEEGELSSVVRSADRYVPPLCRGEGSAANGDSPGVRGGRRPPPPPPGPPPQGQPRLPVGGRPAPTASAPPSGPRGGAAGRKDMGFKMTHISEVPMVAMDQGWEEVGGRRRQRLPKAPTPPPRKETGTSTAFKRRTFGLCFRCLMIDNFIDMCLVTYSTNLLSSKLYVPLLV